MNIVEISLIQQASEPFRWAHFEFVTFNLFTDQLNLLIIVSEKSILFMHFEYSNDFNFVNIWVNIEESILIPTQELRLSLRGQYNTLNYT